MAAKWRRSRNYRIWRWKVIRRDKQCVLCGNKKTRQAHHIQNGSHHPELRYDVDNGVTLCRQCHSQFHNNYKKSYRQKTTKDDWENFLALFRYITNITIR